MVVSLYYVLHKPLTPQLALSIGRAAGQIIVAWGLVSLGGGVGARLYLGNGCHPLARLAVQAALGLGLLSLVVLVVGATLGVGAPLMWFLFLLLGGVFHRQVIAWWRNWGGFFPIWRAAGRLERGIAFGVALILLSTLITALAPPLKFDALVYHLTLPRAYLAAGRITYLPWLMYWGMPQISEMLYTWGMALGGVEAAVVLGWTFGLVALAGIFGLITQRINLPSAWVAVAALLAGFTTAAAMGWGYVGWMTILQGAACLIALDRWVSHHDRKDLLLAGVFAGFALGTKYTAGILLLGGLGVVAWFGRKAPWKRFLLDLFLFGLTVILASSPWLIKNFVATGNPFYPVLFPGGAMDQLRLDFYQDQPLWGGWLEVILLPMTATLRGVEGTPGFSTSVGPLLLALGALAWIGWGKRPHSQRKSLKVAVIISLVGLVTWAVASRFSGLLIQTRLYLTLFPAFALLAGAGFDGLSRIKVPGVRLRRVAGVLALLVLCLTVIQIGSTVLRQNSLQSLLSITIKEEYLLNNLGWYAWVLESIDELPESSQVLMLWEPRSYYCYPKCTPDEVLDRWYLAVRRHRDTGDILQAWRENGYTHLLFYREGADFIRYTDRRYNVADWQLLEEMLAQLPASLEFGDVYTLYPLTSP